jgi:hypothetical protein
MDQVFVAVVHTYQSFTVLNRQAKLEIGQKAAGTAIGVT